MSLSFEDRKNKILLELAKEEKVNVHLLAEELNVSTETIRRDLDRLEKDGKLKKVYGGAVKARLDTWELPFIQRAQINAAEKRAIAALAASLVNYGETIMIDNGTTTLELLRCLRERDDITIVTHSVPTLLLAMEIFKGRIIFVGGQLNVLQQSFAGPLTEMMLQQIKVNKAFISVGGISLNDGITDYDLNEASISRRMIGRSEEAIVLADYSKFGKTTFAKISSIKEVSMIITDCGCPSEWIQNLTEQEIEILVADKEEPE
ncbi:MAG: DeoR/GlpR family DNA-binding transcription regulator [Paenibacillaceae bacterium]